jgi:hypothetical protein
MAYLATQSIATAARRLMPRFDQNGVQLQKFRCAVEWIWEKPNMKDFCMSSAEAYGKGFRQSLLGICPQGLKTRLDVTSNSSPLLNGNSRAMCCA